MSKNQPQSFTQTARDPGTGQLDKGQMLDAPAPAKPKTKKRNAAEKATTPAEPTTTEGSSHVK